MSNKKVPTIENYKIMLTRKILTDGLPDEDCSDYKGSSYAGCINEDLKQQFSTLTGCLPPWMTNVKQEC